jgi:hypothetical protein
MKRPCPILSLFVGLLWTLPCLAQGDDDDQRIQDWKRAAELFKTYFQDLNSKYSFDGREKEYMDRWNKWKTEFVELRSALHTRYGSDAAEITRKFEDLSPPEGVVTYMRQIANDLLPLDVDVKQKEIAGWSVEAGNQAYRRWENFKPPDTSKMELKADYARRALAGYQRAAEIDSKGSYAEMINKAKQALAESERNWKATLVDLKWPGHNADFEGPGDPDALAKAALKLLASVESWSKPEYDDKHTPVGACITARAWQVHKTTPITRVPTQYSLDVLVAFRGTQDPEIAYAYNMVFYTKEEEGVKKEPPFHFVNSRQYAKYKMLMSQVPKMVDSPAPQQDPGHMEEESAAVPAEPSATGEEPEAATPTAGVTGWFMRLVLSVSLVIAWLAATALKVPALASFCTALHGQSGVIGIVLLVVGVFCFLRTTIFYFAPHADLLPQLVAVAMGLLLKQRATPGEAAEKIGGLLNFSTQNAALLSSASLVLGILHLFLGGLPLL